MTLLPLLRRGLVTVAVAAAMFCLAPATAQARPVASFPAGEVLAGVPLPPAPSASDVGPLAVADVDRDGDADLVALADDGTWHVWLNDGDGAFHHTVTSVTPGTLWGSDDYISGGRTHGRSPTARLKAAARVNPGTLDAARFVPLRLALSAPPIVAALAFEPGSPRSPPPFVR